MTMYLRSSARLLAYVQKLTSAVFFVAGAVRTARKNGSDTMGGCTAAKKRHDSLLQLRDPELVHAQRNGRSSHECRTRSWMKVCPILSDAVRLNFLTYENQDEVQNEIRSSKEGITHEKRPGSFAAAAER
jgi:hypothetical protein